MTPPVRYCYGIWVIWWRYQMETFSTLLALCVGNSRVTGEFPSQRPVTRSFDVFFDLRLNNRLSKQSRRQWFETPSRSLWRHSNETNGITAGYVPIYRGPMSLDIARQWEFSHNLNPQRHVGFYTLTPQNKFDNSPSRASYGVSIFRISEKKMSVL